MSMQPTCVRTHVHIMNFRGVRALGLARTQGLNGAQHDPRLCPDNRSVVRNRLFARETLVRKQSSQDDFVSNRHKIPGSYAPVQPFHVTSRISFAHCASSDFCEPIVKPDDHIAADMTECLVTASLGNGLYARVRRVGR